MSTSLKQVRQNLVTRLPYAFSQIGRRRWLPIAFGAAALALTFATYLTLTNDAVSADATAVGALLIGNLTVLSIFGLLVARRLARLWVERRAGSAGSKLHVQLVTLFSVMAIVPTLVVALFSVLFFDLGLQNWFSAKVRTAVENSVTIAEDYFQEYSKGIVLDVSETAAALNRQAIRLQFSPDGFREEVVNQAIDRSFSEVIVLGRTGAVYVRYDLGLTPNKQAPLTALPSDALDLADSGEVVDLSSRQRLDDRFRALMKLDGYYDRYLYVSRLVDMTVLAQLAETQEVAAQYRTLEKERSSIQLNFNLIFVVIALLVLIAAVWAGLALATQIAAPVSGLVSAAERVSGGDLSVRVSESPADNEIGVLSRAFNRMTGQLRSQRNALIDANAQLDQRRRFTEAVLAGVSVGVVGLNASQEVDLPNRAAIGILEMDEDDLSGHRLEDTVPELAELLGDARKNPDQLVQGQIAIVRGGKAKSLFVRIASELADGAIEGFVVTIDDITKLVDAERMAAWADVARRIAHEIKNPLTPIQLSAERLKRKYSDEVSSDPDVFAQCTDTIVRQVGDIRRMVDEFSGFARMPAPTFHDENLTDLARQTQFMQEVSAPDIAFTLNAPDIPLDLYCDGRLIGQALTNVLKNAVESIRRRDKVNGAGLPAGEIAITVAALGGETSVVVQDNGAGLPADRAERLTEPYVTTRAKGTGLGLAIVKKIMSDHGGEVTLEDGESGGARVRLIFSHSHLDELRAAGQSNMKASRMSVG